MRTRHGIVVTRKKKSTQLWYPNIYGYEVSAQNLKRLLANRDLSGDNQCELLTFVGEMHLKDLLGSFVRVGYRIPVPDFYLVLHGLHCRKSTIMD